MVGLATLGLLSVVAASQPMLCVVDDAQWLDPETTRALAFVARRIGADSVGVLFASRDVVDELRGVAELRLGGLSVADSRTLLDSVLVGRVEGPVRERILAETRGNPLALIELPRALTPTGAINGVIPRPGDSLSARIEDSFRQQLETLPDDTRRLLVLAAAEPLGDPLLLLRAASHLGLSAEAADAAEEAGLLQIRDWCSFRHPLVRSAVYGAAPLRERRLAHLALAWATDGALDPDRKAWHHAQATAGPDADVAVQLEQTAARAKARGGLAAAGAFLERAAMLTPDAETRTERGLAAAEVMFEAGSFGSVEDLLRSVQSAHLDDLQAARAELLRVQVSFARNNGQKDEILRLLAVAARLRQADPSRGYAAHLEALRIGFFSANPEILKALSDSLGAYTASGSGAVAELVIRGWAQLLEHGYPAGTDLLRQAATALAQAPQLSEWDLPLLHFSEGIARSMWDFDIWETLLRRTVELARECGSLTVLPRVLLAWSDISVSAGNFPEALSAVAEAQAIAEAIGAKEDWYRGSYYLDAWSADRTEALARIDRQERGEPEGFFVGDYARAVVYNGAGEYEAALDAGQRSCDRHPLGTYTWALVEVVEAAVRCGEGQRARIALDQLVGRTRLSSADWGLGLEARSAALVADGPVAAEPLYLEAIERLARARTRPDCARAHLLYGEWLRRENRRLDAREQLRIAHDMFSEIGIPGFAERARIELAATGEIARRRTDDTRIDLTAQESQIAQLAAGGMTNPEIGAKLFLSARTVEWHLTKVYPKLGVSSRRELRSALSPA
jgi:DNA-binding CsgD family transcriptional regulator